jgi:hypothetical protein
MGVPTKREGEMIFDQQSPGAALYRLHQHASGLVERRADSDHFAKELDDWKALHPDFSSLPMGKRLPHIIRAAIFAGIVFFDALLVSPSGEALALGMSGGNWYAGLAGMVGLPFVIALAELVFAHYAIEELRATGRLNPRMILMGICLFAIPVVSGFFAIEGIAAAFGADSDQKALGYGGAALIAALHFSMILAAESIMDGIGYCIFAIHNARLTGRLRIAGARLAQIGRKFEKSWLEYYAHLHVGHGQPDHSGGPFSVAVTKALSERFNLMIQQTGPAPAGEPTPTQTAPNTQSSASQTGQAADEPSSPLPTNEPRQAASNPAPENEWANIKRRKM